MKQFKMIFDPLQIKNAAGYLAEHNELCKQSADSWEEDIYSTIKEYVAKDSWYVGTGGFYIVFSEDDGHVDVEVLVDPSVGRVRDSVQASYAFGKIIKEF